MCGRYDDRMAAARAVGPYVLEAPLGRGGMADVYRARAPGGDAVVVKRMLPELAGDAGLRAMMLDEARHLRGLRHPGIVSVLDVGEDGGLPYLVLELVDGVDLAAALRRLGPLPVAAVARLGADVADALAHAHAAGVFHRDVTPANVLLDRTGRARLADFGIARAPTQTQLTEHGTVKGKPGYLAPEQALGGAIDGRTDLYALGVTLVEALTGRPLFEGEGPVEAAARIGKGAPALGLPDGTPAPLAELLARCLCPEKAGRPAEARALVATLEAMRGADGRAAIASVVARAGVAETRVLAAAPGAGAPPDSGTRALAAAPSPARDPAPAAVAPRSAGPRRAFIGAGAAALVAVALFAGYRLGTSRAAVVQVGAGGDGTLVLEEVPRRGRLAVDGIAVPVTARTMRLGLAPGRHVVTLAVGRFEYEQPVDVPAGGEEVLRVPLRRLRKGQAGGAP